MKQIFLEFQTHYTLAITTYLDVQSDFEIFQSNNPPLQFNYLFILKFVAKAAYVAKSSVRTGSVV